MNREHAQEFTEALAQVFAGAVRLGEWAPDAGIPKALGLSPAEWAARIQRFVADWWAYANAKPELRAA